MFHLYVHLFFSQNKRKIVALIRVRTPDPSGREPPTMDSGDCETEEDSAPEACVSPEGSLLPSNSREMRNRAEKMRRDKLNSYIGELATLVPMVARSAKRMDKTSILRLAATHLRIYQTLLSGKNHPHIQLPKHVDQYLLEQLVCEQLGGFLLILTPNGKIVFVSHTVEHLLGHLQTDLMGQSIFNITSPDDHDRLRMYINTESVLDGDWKKCFNIRLKRAGPRTESAVYEPVRIMGVHRPGFDNDCNKNTSTSKEIALNNDVLLFFVKVFRPEPLCERLFEASREEYVTRHLIDGRIIGCDQRISFIAGYMTEEVSGLSAFKFMHREDVRWVMIALRQMYDRGESKGSSCYRLLSRNGQFIYLRTFGFLEIDDQGTVESFVCVNTLVSEQEGLQLINEMKKRYSALINSQSCPITSSGSTDSSSQSVEDPQQVEAAIVHLIANLPSPGSDQRSTPSPRVYGNVNENQDCSTPTENSPTKPYYKLKTANNKRPPSTELGTNIYTSSKRQRTSPQLSPMSSLPPYPNRTQITEVTQQTEPSIYQHDQLLRNKV
ncbi:Circadian locomoter output cycles protein kaput-like Protein [Tribolium castaneum]|uniref:Circadian locomoter output cycles protein kaput-like Protein n=2 Tax=Tribolium castaneum TaxID=7070 RepID=A0A139WJY1_TRICA|nr:Circadian locomoter output cycles protein kaput-like Protein [Tribolium castaneum]